MRWVERGGQLGEGAREVWVKVPGVLREGAAVRTQQAGRLGVAGGTWWGRDIGSKSGWPTGHWEPACLPAQWVYLLGALPPLCTPPRLYFTSPTFLFIPLTCLPQNPPCQVATYTPTP